MLKASGKCSQNTIFTALYQSNEKFPCTSKYNIRLILRYVIHKIDIAEGSWLFNLFFAIATSL